MGIKLRNRIILLHLLILIFAINSCIGNKCVIDKEFKRDFMNNIETVKKWNNGEMYGREKYLDALSYLVSITKIESQMVFDETPAYDDSVTLYHDVNAWLEWYENNKCDYTKTKVDSLLN
jgi:hypothetical protein